MHTTLISVIGSPKKGCYDTTRYNINGQVYETEFFFIPLLQHYQPDQFFLLGTEKSIWKRVEVVRQKSPFEYQKVLIPFGVNTKEIWQIFESIVSLPLNNTRLIIDITHGFRAIPFAVFLAALYFQAVQKDVEIVDILYGNYEARDEETGIAPVVHLQSYLDMHQWIRAARRFVQYGDGDLLIQKLGQTLPPDEAIQKFLTEFRRFVDNIQLNFVTQIPSQGRKVLTALTKPVKAQLRKIPPYQLLNPLLRQRLQMFEADEKEWLLQWRIAEWFVQNRQYSQAIIVLREVLITFTAELLELPKMSFSVREKQVSYLHTYLVFWDDSEKLRKRSLTEQQIREFQDQMLTIREIIGEDLLNRWRSLILEINEARNLTGHALMRGGSNREMIDPEEQIERIHQWIFTVKEVFQALEANEQKLAKAFKHIIRFLFSESKRVFVIVNEGIHPIRAQLTQQYGSDMIAEVVTQGNIDLTDEQRIVQRVQEIVAKYPDAQFYLVPSGLPYLITLVYNTLLQITSTHPVYLQYDREERKYLEKDLNPRKWMER